MSENKRSLKERIQDEMVIDEEKEEIVESIYNEVKDKYRMMDEEELRQIIRSKYDKIKHGKYKDTEKSKNISLDVPGRCGKCGKTTLEYMKSQLNAFPEKAVCYNCGAEYSVDYDFNDEVVK